MARNPFRNFVSSLLWFSELFFQHVPSQISFLVAVTRYWVKDLALQFTLGNFLKNIS
jgi:hypothetical protein